MDREWIYGGQPANIFATIVEGRPNGMPSWRGRIPDEPDLGDRRVRPVASTRTAGSEPRRARARSTSRLARGNRRGDVVIAPVRDLDSGVDLRSSPRGRADAVGARARGAAGRRTRASLVAHVLDVHRRVRPRARRDGVRSAAAPLGGAAAAARDRVDRRGGRRVGRRALRLPGRHGELRAPEPEHASDDGPDHPDRRATSGGGRSTIPAPVRTTRS